MDGWLDVIFAPLKVLMNDANWSGGEKLTWTHRVLLSATSSFIIPSVARISRGRFALRSPSHRLSRLQSPAASWSSLETKSLARVCLPLTWSDWIFEIFVRRFLSRCQKVEKLKSQEKCLEIRRDYKLTSTNDNLCFIAIDELLHEY